MREDPSRQTVLGINRQLMAIILMSSGTTLNTLGYIYANQHKLHPFSTGMIRGIATCIIIYLLAHRQKTDLTFASTHNFKWQFYRNIIMLLQTFVYAWSQFYLPLPIAITLQATSPIFATIFDKLIYGISINSRQLIWLIVAFVGVALTSNGNQIMFQLTGNSSNQESTYHNYFSKDPLMIVWVALVLIATMCLHGLGVVMTKVLRGINSVQINFYQGVQFVLISALMIPYGFNDETYHKPSLWQSFEAALFTGIPITVGLLFYTYALLLTKNYGALTPFMFTSIIFGYLVSILRYGQQINVICIMGSIAIIMGVIFIVRNKEKQ